MSPELTPKRADGEAVFCDRCRSVLRDDHGLVTGRCDSCCDRESCENCRAKAEHECESSFPACCDEEGCDLAETEGCCEALPER